MVLFYCTVCALYPSLYTGNLPSSGSTFSEYLDERGCNLGLNNSESILDYSEIDPDLETTSEGLCDHIREIFNLSRQVFNDYQVRAIKKLLSRNSHQQVRNLQW